MNMKCALGIHDWTGCKCSRCDTIRTESHAWSGCKCENCGMVRNEQHDWPQYCEKCSKCGTTRRDSYQRRIATEISCERCGKVLGEAAIMESKRVLADERKKMHEMRPGVGLREIGRHHAICTECGQEYVFSNQGKTYLPVVETCQTTVKDEEIIGWKSVIKSFFCIHEWVGNKCLKCGMTSDSCNHNYRALCKCVRCGHIRNIRIPAFHDFSGNRTTCALCGKMYCEVTAPEIHFPSDSNRDFSSNSSRVDADSAVEKLYRDLLKSGNNPRVAWDTALATEAAMQRAGRRELKRFGPCVGGGDHHWGFDGTSSYRKCLICGAFGEYDGD